MQKLYDTLIEQTFLALGSLEKSLMLLRRIDRESAEKILQMACDTLQGKNNEEDTQ